MFKILSGQTEFNQWDSGQYVTGSFMEVGEQVIFQSATGATYVTYCFSKDGAVVAPVPNKLLQFDRPMLVNYGQCNRAMDQYDTHFFVNARPCPEGYVYTDNTNEGKPTPGGSGGSGGGSSVQSDWNQNDETQPDFIKNKPFGDVYGDTVTVPMMSEEEFNALDPSKIVGDMYIKVSDGVPTMQDISNGLYLSIMGEGHQIPPEELAHIAGEIADGIIAVTEWFVFVSEQGVGVDIEGLTFPESGTYLFIELALLGETVLTIPNFTGFTVNKKIDSAYMPNSVLLFPASKDGTSYLFASENDVIEDKRMTKSELVSAINSGSQMWVRMYGTDEEHGISINSYIKPYDVDIRDGYAVLFFLVSVNSSPTSVPVYTAEYTAS